MDAPTPDKLLVRVGAMFRRAGGSLWSVIRSVGQALRARSGLRVALLIGVLIGVIVSFAETLRERFDAVVTALQIDDREGIILIDTPQLYTRERLVNDRFREAAWLQERLDDTERLVESGRFRQPHVLLRRERRTTLGIGAPEDSNPPQNDGEAAYLALPVPEVTDPNGSSASAATMSTPLDEFDDIARYREAIRNAFMATQLDDRHDIAGNTIYRLNFEAIIVPDHGARKLAAIKVALSGPQDHLPYYLELLEDWRDELQRQVIDLVDDRVETIERGIYLPPSEQARLRTFLNNQFRGHITELALTQFVGRYLDREDEAIKLHYKGFFNNPLDDQALSVLRYQLCGFAPELDSKDLPDTFAKFGPASTIKCQEMRPTTPLLAQLDVAAILIIFRNEVDELRRRCKSKTNDIGDVLTRLVFGEPPSASSTSLGGGSRSVCVDELERLRAHRRQLGDRALRQAVMSAFIAEDLENRLAKTEILGKRPVLGDFFGFDSGHCEVNRCYPAVLLENKYNLPRLLFDYLEDDAQVATYAVTPAKAEQGLALLERQALAYSVQDANLGLWSASGMSAVEAAALEREPIILSIGDWGKLSSTNGNNKVTKFAWIVLPRREASRLGRAAQRPDHVSISAVVSVPSWWKSIQLDIATCWLPSDSLQEVIDPEVLCQTERPADLKQYTLKVAVPGDASEVMNKMRFEVITFPYVLRQQDAQVLEVGRPGTLTILGGRLWRSPTVIMGTEVANRIEVLPDMRGIVAHFECIHPYPGTQGISGLPPAAQPTRPAGPDQSGTRIANAVIWTSEGKTQPISVELRPFARRAGEETDRPCWLDADNGKRPDADQSDAR